MFLKSNLLHFVEYFAKKIVIYNPELLISAVQPNGGGLGVLISPPPPK